MENNFKETGRLMSSNDEGFSIFDSALACVIFIVMTNFLSSVLGMLNVKLVNGSFMYYFIQALAEITFAVSAVIIVYLHKIEHKF